MTSPLEDFFSSQAAALHRTPKPVSAGYGDFAKHTKAPPYPAVNARGTFSAARATMQKPSHGDFQKASPFGADGDAFEAQYSKS